MCENMEFPSDRPVSSPTIEIWRWQLAADLYPDIERLLHSHNGVDIFPTRRSVHPPTDRYCCHGELQAQDLSVGGIASLFHLYVNILADDVAFVLRQEGDVLKYGLRHHDGGVCCVQELLPFFERWSTTVGRRIRCVDTNNLDDLAARVFEKLLCMFRRRPRLLLNPAAYMTASAQSIVASDLRRLRAERRMLVHKRHEAERAECSATSDYTDVLEETEADVARMASPRLARFFTKLRTFIAAGDALAANTVADEMGISASTFRVYLSRVRRIARAESARRAA